VIDRDKKDIFRFAALQSEEGKVALQMINQPADYIDSIVLIRNGKLYKKSKAALLVSQKLNGLWPILSIFLIIPNFLSDWVYDMIARNRYKWFGKKEECRIPTPELRSKFL
jgi:predicted DCC family thiol-disulfide oxidoreductase YuxK